MAESCITILNVYETIFRYHPTANMECHPKSKYPPKIPLTEAPRFYTILKDYELLDPNMKKFIAITSVFLFSATVLLSSAFGYFDCATQCAYEMAKARQHASMSSMGLTGPNCCSGTLKDACEMAGTPEIKIPECSMPGHPMPTPNSTTVGFSSVSIGIDLARRTQADLQFNSGHLTKTPPIYLQTRSILC